MKTYAPKGLRGGDLRGLLSDLAATPAQAAGYLEVSERTVWRWLADGTAPRPVLACLWLETPHGRHVAALDVGNELVIVRGLAKGFEAQTTDQAAQLARVLAISDTGAANDPLARGPVAPRPQRLRLWGIGPLRLDPRPEARQLADDERGDDGASQYRDGFAADFWQAG